MRRSMAVLVVVAMVLLPLPLYIGPGSKDVARAQVVGPVPTTTTFDFDSVRGVIGTYDLVEPAEVKFAFPLVLDQSSFPDATVSVQSATGDLNQQRFWLSIEQVQEDPGVSVEPSPGYAELGLIAPGGEAIYTITFPEASSASVTFTVDGGTDEAALLTLLQFALEAGLASAEITGIGAYDQELALELASVVSEQYLADLPTLAPCLAAVEMLRAGPDNLDRFTEELEECLASPVWQVTVDQVLARVAERDWFQQSLSLAGKAIPVVGLALKTVTAQQLSLSIWSMYRDFHPEIPGAMAGTISFISLDTTQQGVLGDATSVAETGVEGVIQQTRAAVQQAGTYHYDMTGTAEGGLLVYSRLGEARISGNHKAQEVGGPVMFIHASGDVYVQQPAGQLLLTTDEPIQAPISSLIDGPIDGWTLIDTEDIDGRSMLAVERIATDPVRDRQFRETYWIDTATSLPVRHVQQDEPPGDWSLLYDTTFSGFGAAVDVEIPLADLYLTPTPTPTPAEIEYDVLAEQAATDWLLALHRGDLTTLEALSCDDMDARLQGHSDVRQILDSSRMHRSDIFMRSDPNGYDVHATIWNGTGAIVQIDGPIVGGEPMVFWLEVEPTQMLGTNWQVCGIRELSG